MAHNKSNASAPKQLPMVGWYDPRQLLRTAQEVAVSTLFGRHSDYRLIESLALSTMQPNEHHEIAESEEFWFDCVADTGDGWNPTYAIAYTVVQSTLTVKDPKGKEHLTRRGSVLVFAGDQVYPAASRTEYRQRLVVPYETALRQTAPPDHPVVYAIPGNHDWYDSLVAFMRLFCGKSWFGGWQARQTRSYFAAKLPRGWWLLGTDMQLDSDIDQPQVDYFKAIAKQMGPNDRVILCNAEPSWIFAHIYGEKDPEYTENNLRFLEDKVLENRVRVVIAGDLHHYRRHAAPDERQKIVAGGGGAFLHPTNGPDVSRLGDSSFELKSEYPSRGKSWQLCWLNLLFPILNPRFGVLTAVLYMITAWAALVNLSMHDPLSLSDWPRAGETFLRASLMSPVAGSSVIGLMLGFWLFTDTHSRLYRFTAGTLHGLAHVFAVFMLAWVATVVTVTPTRDFGEPTQLLAAGTLIFVGGWFVGSFIMGLYLLISLNFFKRHSNEAFSSLGIQDWKNFLRMKIDTAGNLTIFPIGIKRVPRRWKPATQPGGPELVPDDARATAPELIEPPVVVPK